MSHTATIKYDRSLVRRALNRFMFRRLGIPFFVGLALVVLICFVSYFTGSWTFVLTLLSMAIGLVVAFLLLVYFARLRAAEGFFDKANEPMVTFKFTSEGIRTESDFGTSDLRWQVFEEILKFRDIWLLIYAKSGYMTLPLDQLTPECIQFIEQQMATQGDVSVAHT